MVFTASTENHAMTGETEQTRLFQVCKNNHTFAFQILRLIVGI